MNSIGRTDSEPVDPQRDVVLVPVPRAHLHPVYALLAALMAPPTGIGESDADADELPCGHCGSTAYLAGPRGRYRCGECGLVFEHKGDGVVVDHENGCWTQQMVERLRRELGSSLAARAVDVVAERAPNTVKYEELLAVLGAEQNQLRAELAGLSRASRRLFGRKIWPMSGRQGWGEGARMGYRMPPPVAHWWLAPVPEQQARAGTGTPESA